MKAARLVVLGVAVAAGGLAALLASGGDDTPAPAPTPTTANIATTEILTAKSDIGVGHRISTADMVWQAWPTAAASPHFIRKSDKPNAIEELAGSLTRAPFFAGEPVREAKLIKSTGSGYLAAMLPAGMRAISVDITPASGASGFILPGDRVDAILTRRDREAEKATGVETHVSETILTNVRVLAIDQTVEEQNGQKVVAGAKTATLELSQRQAEALAVSRELGTLSLALRSLADASGANTSAEDDKGNPGSVNMIRFGVTTKANPK